MDATLQSGMAVPFAAGSEAVVQAVSGDEYEVYLAGMRQRKMIYGKKAESFAGT